MQKNPKEKHDSKSGIEILEIFYTPHFLRMFAKLNTGLSREVKEKIEKFTNINNHTSLRVHKLKNLDNTYSFSVNYKIRIVFEYGKTKKIVHLLYVGNHDDLY